MSLNSASPLIRTRAQPRPENEQKSTFISSSSISGATRVPVNEVDDVRSKSIRETRAVVPSMSKLKTKCASTHWRCYQWDLRYDTSSALSASAVSTQDAVSEPAAGKNAKWLIKLFVPFLLRMSRCSGSSAILASRTAPLTDQSESTCVLGVYSIRFLRGGGNRTGVPGW